MTEELDLLGDDIFDNDQERIKTEVLRRTQQGKAVAFWCPKRVTFSMPEGVRPWTIFEKKPEFAVIIPDLEMMNRGRIAIQYLDGTVVPMSLDEFARCGRVFEEHDKITKMYTMRSAGQRDILGHLHD